MPGAKDCSWDQFTRKQSDDCFRRLDANMTNESQIPPVHREPKRERFTFAVTSLTIESFSKFLHQRTQQ